MARKSTYGRLIHLFHEHPRGRLLEFSFWAALGLVFGAVALFGHGRFLSTPIALMLAIVAACFVGWAFLPRQRVKAAPPLPKGKRGEIAKQVRASKAEKKRKDDGLPPPPIRRG